MDTSHLVSLLSNIQLETSDLKYHADTLAKRIEDANDAHGILFSLGFLSLIPLSTKVKAARMYSGGVRVVMDIPWDDRTRARHVYGGCFPEDQKRMTYVENECGGPQILEVHKFERDSGVASVIFYRETFAGDKVNGCEVKTVHQKDKYEYPRLRESYLSIVCPI